MENAGRLSPISSSFLDTAELQERIDEFVYSISDRMDHLQDAEISRDFSLCTKLLKDLAVDAEELGFTPLRVAADDALPLCQEESAEGLVEELRMMMVIVQRIKLGHRSAA